MDINALEEGTLEMQQRLQAEDYLITTKISALFEEAVKEVKAEIGATIIISADLVMSYDEKADITDLIVAKIDKATVSFEDKPVDEEKATEESVTSEKADAPQADAAKADAGTKAEADKKADAAPKDAPAPKKQDKKAAN